MSTPVYSSFARFFAGGRIDRVRLHDPRAPLAGVGDGGVQELGGQSRSPVLPADDEARHGPHRRVVEGMPRLCEGARPREPHLRRARPDPHPSRGLAVDIGDEPGRWPGVDLARSIPSRSSIEVSCHWAFVIIHHWHWQEWPSPPPDSACCASANRSAVTGSIVIVACPDYEEARTRSGRFAGTPANGRVGWGSCPRAGQPGCGAAW